MVQEEPGRVKPVVGMVRQIDPQDPEAAIPQIGPAFGQPLLGKPSVALPHAVRRLVQEAADEF